MNDFEKRLVALDILIARCKAARESQEGDLKRVKSYKGDGTASQHLLGLTKKTLKAAKKERHDIIANLIKAEDAAIKKNRAKA